MKKHLYGAGALLAALFLAATMATAGEDGRPIFVVTSTNNPGGNDVVVFNLSTGSTPSLTWADTVPTGGKGGASTNAGIVQFNGSLGAVANYGSHNVTQLVREGSFISVGKSMSLPIGCVNPDSVALSATQLYVVGANCAASYAWPLGIADGPVVHLNDGSAAQIVAGEDWAAVTLTSGSVVQLPLAGSGALMGASTKVSLPENANMVPLGEAFWGDVLGFTPAHSPDSFAIMNKSRQVFPVQGPTPPFPTNAPCWVAKGPGSAWYTGNSPGDAISIFFSDGQGGVFYKSVPLGGSPTDITVSSDNKWLAVIFSTDDQAYVSVFSIDEYGDLTPVATSSPTGATAFSGVAFSE